MNVCDAPAQTSALGGLIEHDGFGFTVRVAEQTVLQPLESVTVSVYVPAVLTVMLAVVAPLLHLCEYPGVPPDGVVVNVWLKPAQTSALGGLIEHEGLGFTVRVAEQTVLQPLESVTVSVYVPVALTVMLAVVAPVLHLCE